MARGITKLLIIFIFVFIFMWLSDLISVRLHIDGPLMCVSVLLSLFPEVAGYVSKHDRLHNGYSLLFTDNQTNSSGLYKTQQSV